MIPSYCGLEDRYDALFREDIWETDRDIEAASSEIARSNLESREEHRKEVEWTESRERWNAGMVVVQYFSAATTFAVGTAALSAAPVVGGCFVASAIVTFSNRVFQDVGLFHALGCSEELSQKFEIGSALLSGAFALAGGIGAYQVGAIIAEGGQAIVEKTAAIATSVLGAGAQAGKAYTEWHISQLQSSDKQRELGVEDLQHQTKGQAELLRQKMESREMSYQQLQRAATSAG